MANKKNNITDELLAAFLDGNATREEINEILNAMQADEELAEVLAVSEALANDSDNKQFTVIPMTALAADNPNKLCSFDCETFILNHLNFDIDSWSLLETAKVNNWITEDGTPLHHVGRLLELKGLHVERNYDATIENIVEALDNFKQVIVVIDNNMMKGNVTEMMKGDITADDPSLHAVYLTSVEEDEDVTYLDLDSMLEVSIEKDLFLKAWKGSGYYLVTADDNPGGYNPQPIDVDAIPLDSSLEELTEAIAENAHDIWARARMDEGWSYGPIRDDVKKLHPDLAPYCDLPESEKEYDRVMAMNTLRLVRRLGYDIKK